MSTPVTSSSPLRDWQESRALRWLVGVGLAAMVAIGLVLLFLLTLATNNREMYERYYGVLFGLNVVSAALLLLVIGWVAWRLVRRLRQGRFGSRLLVKLAAVFALAGFAPGVLIYVVSYQFVSRSIESWFDVQVEGALEAGLNLGRSTLDALSTDLAGKSRAAAAQLQDTPDVVAGLALERLREQLGGNDIQLWAANGQLIASAGVSRFQLNPERPAAQHFRTARSQRAVTWTEGLEEASLQGTPGARIKALVLVPGSSLRLLFDETRFLLVVQELPESLVANAVAVMEAHREYQERALARQGLRRMYIGTLTLTLFLAVFGAVLLADGVRQVAAGDLTPKVVLQGRDELGGLTRSFADMTQQLADARQAVEHSMQQADAARAHLQTILDNLTTGVIVLDAQGTILSVNAGATRILRQPLAACIGQQLCALSGLEDFGQQAQRQFQVFLGERAEHGVDHWQQSIELGTAVAGQPGEQMQTLLVRGAELPDHARLLVFDDISEIVSAQRSRAWGEVARRLAHEIKNPLTPIQLSAQRLEKKLGGKVEPADQAVLTKSVKTIVDQVGAMERLVNEFRDYARLPAAELKPLDLNALVVEVLHLYELDATRVPVRTELDARCPRIMGDAQQLRQVLHNLLQNAQDATEAHAAEHAQVGGEAPSVTVRTHWSESSARVRLSVLDQGAGFAPHILKRAFEPYVTTKAKGTGLGLAVVKKIADEHGARIDLSNRMAGDKIVGAQVSLSFAVDGATEGGNRQA